MYDQEYKDWLLSLKEGDKAVINVGSYGYRHYTTVEIVRITPTRIIKTSDNREFNNKGYARGHNSSFGRHLKIEPITDEVRESMERMELLSVIRNTKFEEVSTLTLREIVGRLRVGR